MMCVRGSLPVKGDTENEQEINLNGRGKSPEDPLFLDVQ
jgi:hypothetical protein